MVFWGAELIAMVFKPIGGQGHIIQMKVKAISLYFHFPTCVIIPEMNIQISPAALLNLIKSCTRQHLNLTLHDASTLTIIQQYLDYQDKVRKGHLGKTAVFWLSVMDHQRLVFMLINAVKTNNRKLFHVCNGKMANLFFAYDGPNYSRYFITSIR